MAAANVNVDAWNQSPEGLPAAVTVGASTKTGSRASFAHYGNCADLFAPGEDITSHAQAIRADGRESGDAFSSHLGRVSPRS